MEKEEKTEILKILYDVEYGFDKIEEILTREAIVILESEEGVGEAKNKLLSAKANLNRLKKVLAGN